MVLIEYWDGKQWQRAVKEYDEANEACDFHYSLEYRDADEYSRLVQAVSDCEDWLRY